MTGVSATIYQSERTQQVQTMSGRKDSGVHGDYVAGTGGQGKSERASIISRTRRRLEQEKVKCMQRYEARERRVIKTLNYCLTALERLEGWAVFAIFPTDEKQKGDSSYCTFVEQRFRCITIQLQGFVDALKRREQLQTTSMASTADVYGQQQQQRPTPVGVAPGELKLNLAGSPPPDRSRTVTSPLYVDDEDNDDVDDDDAGLDIDSQQLQQLATTAQPLRTQVTAMAKRFVDDGRTVRRSVLEHLHRCRRDLHTVLQWGIKSLDELRDVIDETLADELACMVREKMLRILSDMTDFEEAAEEFERTMSTAEPAGSAAEQSDTGQLPTVPNDDSSDVIPERLSDKVNAERAIESRRESQVETEHSPPTVDRLVLHDDTQRTSSSSAVTSSDDWLGFYSRHHSHWRRSGAASAPLPPTSADAGDRRQSWTDAGEDDDDGLSTFRSDGSTPEPPLSTRPKNLDNHPKILKDQLHRSMASLGSTHDVKFFNRSWTFAGR